jgi:hypothetical protein
MRIPVEWEKIREYAADPLRHDDAMALEAGYPDPFGVGMLSAGYLAYVCWMSTVRRFRAHVRGLVWCGYELLATETVRRVTRWVGSRTVEGCVRS